MVEDPSKAPGRSDYDEILEGFRRPGDLATHMKMTGAFLHVSGGPIQGEGFRVEAKTANRLVAKTKEIRKALPGATVEARVTFSLLFGPKAELLKSLEENGS